MTTTPTGLSRRHFLHALGVTGGAGAMLGAMETLGVTPAASAHTAAFSAPRSGDFTLQGRSNGKRVVVLGAGVAGLAAAYELTKGGYRVYVLEASRRVGGRSWTARRGDVSVESDGTRQRAQFDKGQYMNMGPARIPQHHTTMEYCRELGVQLEVFANANASGYYFNQPAANAGGPLAGTPVRHRQAKADLFGYTSELLAKAVSSGALDAELSASDKEQMIGFLRSFGAISSSNTYAGSSRAGYPEGAEPGGWFDTGTPNPPLDLSALLASGVGRNFGFEAGWDQAMLMFQPVGGMDAIPQALAEQLPLGVNYGAAVTRIENTSTGVKVSYSQNATTRSIEADYCVCTIPPQVVKGIDSNFSAQVKADLAVPVGAAAGKVGQQYGRRFWETDDGIMGGITNTNMDNGTIWYPSSGYLGEKGIVVGSYNFGGNATAYGNLTPAERVERTVQRGSLVHGDAYRSELETAFTVAWHKMPLQQGAWVSWPSGTQGGPGTPYGRLTEPAGNVYFAGDHMSHVIAWQHGAFESARKTVSSLHARALAS
ncbi:flavin monoamine oxidase family protein [Aquipuribacter sp. MA13-6]|uniref:flavin monoamine oxidase family protein n=1 Tax=unclassified Aquipuribacter TaxID=2635084 RepID=UPI003EEB56DB